MKATSTKPGISRNVWMRPLGVLRVGILVYVCLIASAVVGQSPQESGLMSADESIRAKIPNEDRRVFLVLGADVRDEARSLSIFRAIQNTSVGAKVINSVEHQMAAEVETYAREMNASGWISVWDSEFVAADNALADSRMKIRKAREAVSAFRLRITVLLDTADSNIDSYDISAESKASMHSLFNINRATIEQDYDTLLSLEEQFIELVERVCDVVSSNHGVFLSANGTIMCDDKLVLEMLDTYLVDIDEVVRRKDILQQTLSARINRSTDNMWEKY